MSEASKLPSEVVALPPWVAAIERRLLLLAIVHDLKEDRGEVFILATQDDDGDIGHDGSLHTPVHTLSEARRVARNHIALCAQHNDADPVVRIYVWSRESHHLFARMDRRGIFCVECDGVGKKLLSQKATFGGVEGSVYLGCNTCKNTGRIAS